MNKPSKCKNCQWYGKPYWSIINPCDSCPNEDNVEIITIGDVKPIKEYLTEEEIKKAMTDKSIFEIIIEEKDKEIERLNNIIKNIEENTIESADWDCEVYKGHKCRYSLEDYSCDKCIFCGEPNERK